MSRLVLVQLVMFAVIAAVVVPFGITYVAGPRGLITPITINADMTDAFGLNAGTSVTLRGVQVGVVDEVELTPDGARIRLALDPDTRVPSSSVLTVGMATAAGIQSVDILPDTAEGPFLQSGDSIAAPADRQPMQMDQLMVQASALAETVDPDAVARVGAELSESFDGLGPELATLIDNGSTIAAGMRSQTGELRELITGTARLVTTMAAQRDAFPAGMRASARMVSQLDASGPVFVHLTDQSPAALANLQRVLDQYSGTFGAMLANLATAMPVISDRSDALATGLVAIPEGLSDLASIVKGDRADFSLVATQGPVCDYDVDRRAIGDLSPREPSLVMYCPPAPDMQMRGAANAPRPNDLGLGGSQIPGVPIGPDVVDDPMKIPTLAELVFKWRSVLKGMPYETPR